MCKVNVNVITPELSKIFKELNIFDIKFNGNIESNKGVVLGINFDHSKMSYIPTRRWSVFTEQGNIEAAIFDRNIRKSHAVQSSVRKCLNACQCILNAEDIKKLEQYFNTPKDIEIKIIGDDISDYYAIDHLDLHGSLASSCMQGNDQDYFEIYDREPNVEMIIAINARFEFVGRALLWTDANGESAVFESLTDGLEYSFQKSNGKNTEFHLSAFKGEIFSVHTEEHPDAPPPPKPRYTMYGEEIEKQ